MQNIIIDTNLILDDENILYKLLKKYSKIIIPLTVLKELDKLKFSPDTSFSARKAITTIRKFISEYPDQIEFYVNDTLMSDNDAKIIEAAVDKQAAIATKDISMSILAEAKGIKTETYEIVLNNIFKPYVYINIKKFNNDKDCKFDFQQSYVKEEYNKAILAIEKYGDKIDRNGWIFIFIEGGTNDLIYANNPEKHKLERIDNVPEYRTLNRNTPLKAMDDYQVCAFYALKEAPNVLLTGTFGSGKSLISTAYCTDHKSKAFVTRAPVGLNKRFDIGFTPGPQPLYAKILTPTGWTTMGKVKVGDFVIGDDGIPAKVEKVFNVGVEPVYKIETTNGGITHACENHLWSTRTNNKEKFTIKSTKQIRETLENTNHFLPDNDIVLFNNDNKLPIPPYTMGVLLGDGCFSTKVFFANEDKELIERVRAEVETMGLYLKNHNIIYNIFKNKQYIKIPKVVKILNINSNTPILYASVEEASKDFGVTESTMHSRCACKRTIKGFRYEFLNDNRFKNPINKIIKELKLSNTKAPTKFIPDIYKYTSVNNRIDLLRGLMDTDGHIKSKTGEQSFTTTSKQLSMDIIELCKSLGLNATYSIRDRIGKKQVFRETIIENKHITYQINIPKSYNINPFYISRKSDKVVHPLMKTHNKIKSIEYKANEYVRCIKVNNKNNLYITDDYIVTHNSKDEKMIDWVSGVVSALYYLNANTRGQKDSRGSDYDYVRDELFKEKFEIIPINSIQGLSLLKDDILMVDEVQLLDIDTMSMLLSRPTRDGKLILLGDLGQTYNVVKPSESGLLKLLRILPHRSIAYVELKQSHRGEILELANLLQNKTIF